MGSAFPALVFSVRRAVALCWLSEYTGLTPNGETDGVLTRLRSSFQFLVQEPDEPQLNSFLPPMEGNFHQWLVSCVYFKP